LREQDGRDAFLDVRELRRQRIHRDDLHLGGIEVVSNVFVNNGQPPMNAQPSSSDTPS